MHEQLKQVLQKLFNQPRNREVYIKYLQKPF